MLVQYNGQHSIVFGKLGVTYEADISGTQFAHSRIEGKHSWEDWHLIPTSRPTVNPPSPNVSLINIPGKNGSVDFSKMLTGYMTYQNRSGSWQFIVDNTKWGSWEAAYTTILNYLHGESLVCYLADDPAYYYEGLFYLGEPSPSSNWSTITINYNLFPYKRNLQTINEPWLWDPFNFENGIITEFTDYASGISVPAKGKIDVTIYLYEEPIRPMIDCSAADDAVQLIIGGKTTSLKNGEHHYRGITLFKESQEDNRELIISLENNSNSAATVKFSFRGGEL